eukprot:GHVL01040713.1.p1 GENE.GHVL01040713.1~~GHVL01040713.1.p1  ORF type:complete len:116 (+),score=19.09 GHVL01040713.1:512-859(+)
MVNQVELHPLCAQKELIEWGKCNKCAIQSYSPLGCGELLADLRFQKLTRPFSCSQVLLKWASLKADSVLARARSIEHISDNIKNVDIPSEIIKNLDNFDETVETVHFCWDPSHVA